MISTVSQLRFFKRRPEGYLGPGENAPMVLDSSDESDNETCWKQPHTPEIIGSEAGIGLQVNASYIPVPGGPFSALVPTMWPQDILGLIQQTEDAGSHPDCEYDEFGNCIEAGQGNDTHDPDPTTFVTTEDPTLRLKWVAYLESTQNHVAGDLTWDKVKTLPKSDKLKDLVYSGIPHSMRIHVWPRICGSLKRKAQSKMSYKKLLRKCEEQEESIITKQIDKDLCRTMPNNACFQAVDGIGIQKLRRILVCIAYLYPEIGYCQGIGMIVSSLLLFIEEEDVFWTMCVIIKDLLPPSYFSSTLIGVQADQRVLRQLIVSYLPNLDSLLREHDIELSLITLHWFLTIMSSVLPLRMLLRVLDIFFYDGSITLFRITLGMLKMKEPTMLTLENSAQIFNALSDLPGEINDPDELIQSALKASASLTDIILEAHRKKHIAFLKSELEKSSISADVSMPIKAFQSLSIMGPNSWLSILYRYGPMMIASQFCGSRFGTTSSIATKAKNIKQTEMLSDLRESILLVAKHFKNTEAKKVLEVDYSVDSHAKDYENYLTNARRKLRRAKAIVDFERHEDDELGFRKHDIITIISQKDDHCWIGELNGLRGWFPAKFVRPLDERSKEYSVIGDDTVNEAVTDLIRGHFCTALKNIFQHGMNHSGLFGAVCHPWMFIEEASKVEVQKDFSSVYSRLVLCKTYRLDVDGKVLSPEELMYRAVQAINSSHDPVKAPMDVKFRSFICYGLNEQVLHLWFEVLCLSDEVLAKWYHPHSFLRSPAWIQIKCELRSLALFSLRLSVDWELANENEQPTVNMKEDVQDMLVKHHLFSWDL